MKFNAKIPEIGWHALLRVYKPLYHGPSETGWRVFECGVFRIVSLPPSHEYLSKRNYRGFRFRIAFWLPFELWSLP